MKVLRNPGGGSARVSRWLACLVLGLIAVLVTACGGSGASGQNEQSTPDPVVQFSPEDGAEGVSPADPVSVTVQHGKIDEAVLTNDEGEEIPGEVSEDGTKWTVGQKLGYNRTYTLEVTVRGEGGSTVTEKAEFSTINPENQTYVSMNPLDGQTVGVGQPLAFYFSSDSPAPDKEKAEQAIKIQTEPAVEGAFYWFNDREVHWRPKEYWKPGTTVRVSIDVYGRDLGNGVWGEEDREATINIGDSVILRADGATHQMTVEKNGEVLRTIPVALGKPDFPSNNGVHVVTEHHATKIMDSTTYGLPLDQGGYRTEVKWAVRISNGGEFLHAAPWAAGDLGQRNVSHGCINMTDEDAKWVYDLLKKGDVVIITNSGGPDLRPWDGFGDWQIPWEQWVQGNK